MVKKKELNIRVLRIYFFQFRKVKLIFIIHLYLSTILVHAGGYKDEATPIVRIFISQVEKNYTLLIFFTNYRSIF